MKSADKVPAKFHEVHARIHEVPPIAHERPALAHEVPTLIHELPNMDKKNGLRRKTAGELLHKAVNESNTYS